MNDHMNHQVSSEQDGSSSPQSNYSRTKCPGVSIIRREFVDLTGDHFSAVVLNQLLYWTQRVKDFDLLLEEERSFYPECNVQPRHGWIYKTAPELIEETMLKSSPPTMRKYLKHLADHGWIDERPHPLDKWKKTTQYRVNLRKLNSDLQAIGHRLPEVYRAVFVSSVEEENKNSLSSEKNQSKSNLPSNHNSSEDFLCSKERNFLPDKKDFVSNQRIFPSKEKNLASYTYTETTSKNKNKEHTQDLRAREFPRWDSRTSFENDFLNQILETWKSHIGQDVHLTDERASKLKLLLTKHFQNDLSQWESFCGRIKSSPFLMGEGSRKWRVTFDWILEEGNLLKILEGNFDSPENLQLKKEEDLSSTREKERCDILAAIEDPTWKYWCTQLSRVDLHQESLSLFELQRIANAKFAEFDGRLVWIESEDPKVLSHIEDLRLKILSVIEKTYPKARNIRTQVLIPLNKPQEQPNGENHAE